MDKDKVNYGLDAPAVILRLFFLGGSSLLLAILAYYLLKMPYAVFFFWYLFLTAITFWFPIPLMILSSKVGKIAFIRDLIPSFSFKGDEMVLDVGCGKGLLLNTIAKHLTTGKSFGIDVWNSDDQLGNHPSETRKNAEIEGVIEKVEIHTGDMRNMPFPSESFDYVFSCLALHHLKGEGNRRAALYEMMRLLKGNGKLILIDFQHIQEYRDDLKSMGYEKITISPKTFKIFPPVRVLTIEK